MSNEPADFEIDAFKYRVALAGAYRKPPPHVGAPALVLHYGLWRPDVSDDNWHRAIDHFLYALFLRLKADPGFDVRTVSPNYAYRTDTLYLFRGYVKTFSEKTSADVTDLTQFKTQSRSLRYDMVSIRTQFRDMHLLIRAELYSEFWNLDFICDFDKIDRACVDDEYSSIRPYALDFTTIYKLTCKQFADHFQKGRVERLSEIDHAALHAVRTTLHRRFRDLITDNLLEPSFSVCTKSELGIKFNEFHGAVLGLQPIKQKFDERAHQDHRDSFDEWELRPITVSNTPPDTTRTIHSQVGNCAFTGDSAVRVVDALWPLIKEAQRTRDGDEEDEEKYGKPEFTVSLLQDRRSIYASSLGWLDPQLDSTETKPIIYTLIVSYQNHWALGRLIERIHNMGSFRLAAIRDIEAVIHVGDKLNQLEDDFVNKRQKKLSVIEGDDFADQCLRVGSQIPYGLMHRVERSEYYVFEFERNLRDLRCDRVEGFQPYNQFVYRRMYGTFDYIKRVGQRYNDLRQDIDLVLRKNYTSALHETTDKIEEIQALGELALFGGLLPYYVSTVIGHISGYNEINPAPPKLWAIVWIVLVCVAFIRLRRSILEFCRSTLRVIKEAFVKHVLN